MAKTQVGIYLERYHRAIVKLERRGVVTTQPEDADSCCGLERDEDGFCVHRSGHPVYVCL